ARLTGPSSGAANKAVTQNDEAAIPHQSALRRPCQIANNAIPPQIAAKRSPKDRSDEPGGGPSLCRVSCQFPSVPVPPCPEIACGMQMIPVIGTNLKLNLEAAFKTLIF